MKLSSYLTSKFVLIDLEVSTVEELISKTVDNLSLVNREIKEKSFQMKEALMEREKKMSTAIGEEILMPHARIEEFEDFIVSVVKLKKSIMVKNEITNREEEVKIAIFIISNSLKNENILKVMGNFAKMAKANPDFIRELKNATSANQVVKLIDKTSIEMTHDIVAEDVINVDIKFVSPTDTLGEIEEIFIKEHLNEMAIVDKDGEFKGQISIEDLISYGMPKFPEFEDFDFMTGKPFKEYSADKKNITAIEICKKDERVIVEKDTPIMEVWFLIVVKGIKRLYVVEKGKYLGAISSLDLLKKVQNM